MAVSRRQFIRAGAATAASAAMAATPALSFAQARTVTIGQLVPWGGYLGELGQDAYYGAKACFDEANASAAIKGVRLELAMLDDNGLAAWARSLSARLVKDYGAQAVLGCTSGPVAKAALEVLKPAGVPLWGPLTASEIADDGSALVRFRAGVQREVAELFKAHTQSAKRVLVLHFSDAFGQADFAQAQKAIAATGLGSTIMPVAVHRDFPLSKEHLQKIGDSKPDVVLVMIYAYQAQQASNALAKAGLVAGRTVRYMATSDAGASHLARALGATAEGTAVATSVPSYTNSKRAVVRRYQAAMARIKEARQSYASFESYLSAAALVETLKTMKDISPQGIVAAARRLGRTDLGDFTLALDNTQSFVELAVVGAGGRIRT
jgi:ABC-type branched-subunit amino acid transport system substrate-binding protein